MPITLTTLSEADRQNGYYQIAYTADGGLGEGQLALLEVGTGGPLLDITAGFGSNHYPYLLELFAKQGMWAQNASFRVLRATVAAAGATGIYGLTGGLGSVAQTGTVTIVEASAAKTMRTPVRPYEGTLVFGDLAAVKLGGASPRLRYTGNGSGRFLTKAVNGRYYFTYKSRLETDLNLRGFDCTTYILAAYDVVSKYGGGDGADVAKALECQDPCLESVDADTAEAFFERNPSARFVMWKPGTHVVLVLSGTVHEFNNSNLSDGYKETEIMAYLKKNDDDSFSIAAMKGEPVIPLPKAPRSLPRDRDCVTRPGFRF